MTNKLKSVKVKSNDILKRDEFLTEYYRNGDVNSKSLRNRWMDPTAAACIKIISESIGKLTPYLYKKTPSGDERVFNHQFSRVLTARPNDFQSIQSFIEMIIYHLCIDGNFYAVKQMRGNKLLGFLPIERPSSVMPVLREGHLYYHLTPNPQMGLQGYKNEYPADEILHVRMASGDMLKGLGCIEQARLCLDLAIVQREHSLNFAEKASIPSGIVSLKTDGVELDDEAYDETVDALNASFANGTDASGKLAVLPGSIEYHQLAISNADAQFLESRMYGLKEICAIFRVPPHMINGDNPKYSNLEQSKLSFYTETISPFISRIQTAFDRHLEEFDVFFGLDERELTRGDSQQVANKAMNLFKSGIITLNEARAELGLTQLDGCDRFGMPMNNIRLGTAEELLELQLVMALPELTQDTTTSTDNLPLNTDESNNNNNEEDEDEQT